MGNPLFNALGKGAPNMSGALGNFNTMIQQFNEFKRTFQGNPEEQVQQLLNSGKMTQQQYDQLHNTAKAFMQMLPK